MNRLKETNTELRFLTDTDWNTLHSTMQRAFADYAVDVSYMTVDYMKRRSEKNGVDLSISPGLFDKGDLVGMTLIGTGPWKRGPAAFDSATGLIKEWRGQGYASLLFDYTLPHLRERKLRHFVLEVLQENGAAIRAYEKSGFHIIRELDCYEIRPSQPTPPSRPPSGITIGVADASVLDEFEPIAEWPLSWECSFVAQRRSTSAMVYLVAQVDGECVGLLSFNRELDWLMALVVKPAWRGQGIAKALIDRMLVDYGRVGQRIRADNIDRADAATQALLTKKGFVNPVSQYEMEFPLN